MKNIKYISEIALVVAIMAGCNLFDNPRAPKTFLIPSGYEGTLRVVLEEKCGEKPEEENGRQIFKFGKNGFLVLAQDFLNVGKTDEFYLVDDKGNKTKVTRIFNEKDRLNNLPAITVSDTAGVTTGEVHYNNSERTVVSGTVAFVDFHLYNKRTTEIKKSYADSQLDNLTNAIVGACRAGK